MKTIHRCYAHVQSDGVTVQCLKEAVWWHKKRGFCKPHYRKIMRTIGKRIKK